MYMQKRPIHWTNTVHLTSFYRPPAANKMDRYHHWFVMNKQPVIEKLYFMLSRLVNERLCAVQETYCSCVCV